MFGIDTFFGSHELIALKLMDIFPVEEKATQLEEFAVHAFHEGRRYEEDKFATRIHSNFKKWAAHTRLLKSGPIYLSLDTCTNVWKSRS